MHRKTQLLFVEACIYLGWARFLVYLPFSWVAPYLGVQMRETPSGMERAHTNSIRNVHHAIRVISRHTFWESTCLVRAIAALKMLQRRKIAGTLYLGTAKDGNGRLIAHAWLRSGPFYLTGAEEMEKFTVVGKISPKITI
ncbi:lasso peptide biosynthesis B2 protein [Phosphitispora fastidiosa]|uniref:lasso peptide biosynthesis B2 protein n=1 Tax=Phosphitispora fastidiosa TaxID=2837202 RepID=UPI001E389EE1|nr:lasso peptide biosynthesis B2 protein [Phosphitispora fastidiosa]MBU7007235.1 hypothetical protein [Phosphitispora fastidiosa]